MIDDFRLISDYCISRGERSEEGTNSRQYAVGSRHGAIDDFRLTIDDCISHRAAGHTEKTERACGLGCGLGSYHANLLTLQNNQ